MKVEVYFVDEEPETLAVHGLDPYQFPEFTLCRMAWEEWDCHYDYKKRITNKPITCQRCIDVLEGTMIFKKTNGVWS